MFWDIYNKKIEVWNPDDPFPPFVKLFRKIDFFLKDGFPNSLLLYTKILC